MDLIPKKMYGDTKCITQGVYGPSDIVYELGLWNHTLKENGFPQQVLFKFHFGCVTLKKSQVVIIQVILQSWEFSLLGRYYRDMIKKTDSNSIVFQLTRPSPLLALTESCCDLKILLLK